MGAQYSRRGLPADAFSWHAARMLNTSRLPALCASLVAALAGAGALPASAAEPTCVTLCQQKVDACAGECAALAGAVYRDPASLQQCQLQCAKGLFVSCFERCSQTGEVVSDDYGIVAEHPDRLPSSSRGSK